MLKERILSDLTAAMKAKEAQRLQVLRSLKAKLLEKEIEMRSGGHAEITEEDAIAVLTKAAKQRKITQNEELYPIPDDRLERPCGGPHGFDDFVERWHE